MKKIGISYIKKLVLETLETQHKLGKTAGHSADDAAQREILSNLKNAADAAHNHFSKDKGYLAGLFGEQMAETHFLETCESLSDKIAEGLPHHDLDEAQGDKFEPWPRADALTQKQIMQLLSAIDAPRPTSVSGKDAWPPSAPLTPEDRKQLTLSLQALARTAPK